MNDSTLPSLDCRHFLKATSFAAAFTLETSLTGQSAEPEPPSLVVEPKRSPRVDVREKLAALQPNHAIALGQAEVIGEFNETARRYDLHKTGPMARDFTIKTCWAPDRKRMLYCGANHAVPHRLNDVWEFDLPSLTWIMLYAPDLPRGYGDLGKDTSDCVYRDGILLTRRGGPAVIAHTWWGLTYDPRHHALLFMNTWVTDRKKAAKDLGGDPATLYDGPPLWAFFPYSRTWKPFKAAKPYPKGIFGGMLEYIPELKGSIWHANNWQMHGTWRHDFEHDSWKDLQANGSGKSFEKESPEPEQIGYYDPVRKIVVALRHYDTSHFDPLKREWKKVLQGNKDDGKTPFGHDARSVIYHDPQSGHGLLVQFQTDTLWAYNPDQLTWTRLKPEGAAMPRGNKRLAYVDPIENVLLMINGTTVWAYRYQAPSTHT